MQRVKSKGNRSTEQRFIAMMKVNGITSWRRNYKVFGHPDFVFPKKRIAIFPGGCLWHGDDCRNTKPKQNKEYWDKKIARNMARDKEVTEHLERLGWLVLRTWEYEITQCTAIVAMIKGDIGNAR